MRYLIPGLLAATLFCPATALIAAEDDEPEVEMAEDEDGWEEEEHEATWDDVVAVIGARRPSLIALHREMELRHPEWAEDVQESIREAYEWIAYEEIPKAADILMTQVELEVRVEMAGEQIDGMSGEQRTAALGELRGMLGKLFEAKVAMRQLELELLQEEMREIAQGLERATANRERIIEARLREFAGDDEDLDFDW